MDSFVPHQSADDFLGLLNERELGLYNKITKHNVRFYKIIEGRDPARREMRLEVYYDSMCKMLEQAQRTNNPVLMFAVEYSILRHDAQHLKMLAQREGVDRFLQSDITGNQKGLEEVGAALGALAFQSENNDFYHTAIDVGTVRSAFDSQKLAIDVVRGSAKSHAGRLRMDMRGLTHTKLERQKSAFLGKRHENMTVCENIYKTLQRKAKREREAGR